MNTPISRRTVSTALLSLMATGSSFFSPVARSLFSDTSQGTSVQELTMQALELDTTFDIYLRRLEYNEVPYTYQITDNVAAQNSIKIINVFGGIPETDVAIEDRIVSGPYGDLGLRIYTPLGGDGPFPVLLYMHGGGWRVGSVETHDAPCRTLATRAKCIIVSVDYHLTSQGFVYPVQRNECFFALKWIHEHAHSFNGDQGRLAVGGDSAGGNMAAVLALMARDQLARDQHGPKLTHQLLIYPVTDYYRPDAQSYKDFATGYFLSAEDMKDFFARLLPSGFNRDDPYLFPLKAPSLKKLPPATIIAARCDVLYDDGREYARRLQDADVHVEYKLYPAIHTFINLRGQSEVSDRALTDAAHALHNAFYRN